MSRACKIGRMNSGAAAVVFAAVFMMVLFSATASIHRKLVAHMIIPGALPHWMDLNGNRDEGR